MSWTFDIRYRDRRSGALCHEQVFAEPFLYWLYNTRPGAWLNALLVDHPALSRLYGWWQRQPWSRARIERFIAEFQLDPAEFAGSIGDYRSFHDFFVRRIRLQHRPLHADPLACIAPCDGKVLVYPRVDSATRFRIKRSVFDLNGCIGDPELAARFDGGAMVVSRLSFADYHYFHFPDAGVPSVARAVPGRYHAGGPYAQRHLIPFFSENYRMITHFESETFGDMLLIEVGALTVGSIEQNYEPDKRVHKGDVKGHFDLGGSTVVLLFRPGVIRFDEDLCRATEQDLETYVRLGDRLGRRV